MSLAFFGFWKPSIQKHWFSLGFFLFLHTKYWFSLCFFKFYIPNGERVTRELPELFQWFPFQKIWLSFWFGHSGSEFWRHCLQNWTKERLFWPSSYLGLWPRAYGPLPPGSKQASAKKKNYPSKKTLTAGFLAPMFHRKRYRWGTKSRTIN